MLYQLCMCYHVITSLVVWCAAMGAPLLLVIGRVSSTARVWCGRGVGCTLRPSPFLGLVLHTTHLFRLHHLQAYRGNSRGFCVANEYPDHIGTTPRAHGLCEPIECRHVSGTQADTHNHAGGVAPWFPSHKGDSSPKKKTAPSHGSGLTMRHTTWLTTEGHVMYFLGAMRCI